ncbi:MAG: KH domain-containing protein [Oscillospiraceae bacterium]|jgi:spoIIIJ-associated protein|nr:KH domain-containing protein [Oscillospiraceae bacterium]
MKFLDKLLKRVPEAPEKSLSKPNPPEGNLPESAAASNPPRNARAESEHASNLFAETADTGVAAQTVSIDELRDAAEKFICEFLPLFGSDSRVKSITVEPMGERAELRIDLTAGSSPGRLIGKHAETIDALQRIVAAIVNRNSGDDDFLRVRLDVDGYRAKRETQLREIALRTAERAKKTRRSVSLEPMNSYERHIIHEALQGVSGISTHSSGTEPNRYIVVSANRGGHYNANKQHH